MILNNKLNTAKTHLGFLLSLVATIGSLVTIHFETKFQNNLFLLAFPALSVVVYGTLHLIKPFYIHYDSNNTKLLIRYFYIHPFISGKKLMLDIPKSIISGVELKKSFFGLKQSLVIEVRHNNVNTSLAPISLSLVSAGFREKIMDDLNTIINKNIS